MDLLEATKRICHLVRTDGDRDDSLHRAQAPVLRPTIQERRRVDVVVPGVRILSIRAAVARVTREGVAAWKGAFECVPRDDLGRNRYRPAARAYPGRPSEGPNTLAAGVRIAVVQALLIPGTAVLTGPTRNHRDI